MKPSLALETFEYAQSTMHGWRDNGAMDSKGFQARYLFRQALGALEMAEAFWSLFRLGHHDAGRIIARHLLERIYSARLAKQSPADAVDLIIHDIGERIKRMKQWLEDNPSVKERATIQQRIAEHENEQTQFLSMLGRKPSKLDFFSRAKLIDLGWSYRSLYWDFSRHVHASFELPKETEMNVPQKDATMIALFAPMDTTHQLHTLTCPGKGCDMGEKYKKLYNKIMRATVRASDRRWEDTFRF